jgi:redox-sensitive bicupin YhaK (pirin superfamily)
MQTTRRAEDRGYAEFGRVSSQYTFSFGDYHDPRFVGFGALLAINEQRILAGGGLEEHTNRQVEILCWVLSGVLEHQDSLGTRLLVGPADLLCMSSGAGLSHHERNPAAGQAVHFLRVWLASKAPEGQRGLEMRSFSRGQLSNHWQLIASPQAREGSVRLQPDVDLYAARLAENGSLEHVPAPNRLVWLQVVRGCIIVGQNMLCAGDAASWIGPQHISLRARDTAEVLLFDMQA